MQIGGVAVIYFNYSYSIFIFLGLFGLDAFEITQMTKRQINTSNCNHSSLRTAAINSYGKIEDMVEDVFNRENDNLAKPNKTAKQIIDLSKEQMIFIVILLVTFTYHYFLLVLLFISP